MAVDTGLVFEAWTLPESGTFERKFVIKDVVDYEAQWRNSEPGTLVLILPDDYAQKDGLLYIDSTNHANDIGSVIRCFREGTLLGEWYCVRIEDTFSDEDPILQVFGEGIESSIDKMVVLPYDYSADPTRDPDWIYGAESILDEFSFEAGGSSNEIQTVWNDATGGTFRLTLDAGANYTGDIDWDASASTVQTEIETLPQVTECSVLGTGDSWNPWTVEFTDPTDPGATLTTDDALLTGGTTTITLQTEGGTGQLGQWTESLNPVTGELHGVYTTFEVSTEQARTGTYSLKVDGGAPTAWQQWPGAQQILQVTPGRLYRGNVWLWSTSSTDQFALVVRDVDENLIVKVETTLTASTWTQVQFPSFVCPDGVTDVIFRVAYVGSSNPAAFYLDDATFAPGFVAATLGEIFNDLLDDLSSEVTVGTWLTRSFTDSLDSNGDAWDQDLSWAIKRGQTLRQLLDYAKRWGYEYQVSWSGSAHVLDLYNPDALGTDYSTAGTPALVGQITGSGPLVRRIPAYSWLLAEGDRGAYGVAEDTDLTGAFGKWMSYWANRTARTSAGLASAASQRIVEVARNTEGFVVRTVEPATLPAPGTLWLGDTVQVQLEDKQAKNPYRVAALTVSQLDGIPQYEYHMSSRVFTREAATVEAVSRLLREYRGLDDFDPDGSYGGLAGGRSGSIPTVLAAGSNARPEVKAMADFIGTGTDDHLTLQAAIDEAAIWGRGRVLIDGRFDDVAPGSVDLKGCALIGTGRDSTSIFHDGVSTSTDPLIDSSVGGAVIRDLELVQNVNSPAIKSSAATFVVQDIDVSSFSNDDIDAIVLSGNVCEVSGINIWGTAGRGIYVSGSDTKVTHNYIISEGHAIQASAVGITVQGNLINVSGHATGACGIEVTVGGCTVSGNFGNVSAPGSAHGRGVHAIAVLGASINNNVFAGGCTNGYIRVEGNSSYVHITDNILIGGVTNAEAGIQLVGGSGTDGDNRITGNTVYDVVGSGIYVEDTDDCLITGNRVDYIGVDGIELQGDTADCLVVGNIVTRCTSDGIVAGGTSNNNSIYGNQVDVSGTAYVDTSSGTNNWGPQADQFNLGITRTDGYVMFWDNASGTFQLKDGDAAAAQAVERVAEFSDSGTASVKSGTHRLYNRSGNARTIVGCWVSSATAPATSTIIVDVNKDGTSIYPTSTKPTIALSGFVSPLSVPDTTAWADGSYLTVDVDQVGAAGNEGSDLVIGVVWKET